MCVVKANTPGYKVGISNIGDYGMLKFEESNLKVKMSLKGSQLTSFSEASLYNFAKVNSPCCGD